MTIDNSTKWSLSAEHASALIAFGALFVGVSTLIATISLQKTANRLADVGNTIASSQSRSAQEQARTQIALRMIELYFESVDQHDFDRAFSALELLADGDPAIVENLTSRYLPHQSLSDSPLWTKRIPEMVEEKSIYSGAQMHAHYLRDKLSAVDITVSFIEDVRSILMHEGRATDLADAFHELHRQLRNTEMGLGFCYDPVWERIPEVRGATSLKQALSLSSPMVARLCEAIIRETAGAKDDASYIPEMIRAPQEGLVQGLLQERSLLRSQRLALLNRTASQEKERTSEIFAIGQSLSYVNHWISEQQSLIHDVEDQIAAHNRLLDLAASSLGSFDTFYEHASRNPRAFEAHTLSRVLLTLRLSAQGLASLQSQ